MDWRRDDGLGLIETLVSITLLGVGVVAILASWGTLTKASASHRDNVEVSNSLVNVAEAVTAAGYATGCTQDVYDAEITSALAATGNSATVDVTISYWDGDSFEAGCLDATVDPPHRIQQVEIASSYRDASGSLTVLKRATA